jgi:hypothetical protein
MSAMGFNPFRSHDRDLVDIAMVAGMVLVIAALVLWAISG